MDNFDKLFNKKLNEITENDFEMKESSWERFHNQWNEREKRTTVIWLWVKRNAIAAAVIGLLLTSNVFFAQQSIYTQNRMKELADSVHTIQKSLVASNRKAQESEVVISDLRKVLEKQETIIEEQKVLLEAKAVQLEQQSALSVLPQLSTNNDLSKGSNIVDNKKQTIDKNSTNNTGNTVNSNSSKEDGQHSTNDNVNNTSTNSDLTSGTNIPVTSNDNTDNNATDNFNTVIAGQQPTIALENQITDNASEAVIQAEEISYLDNLQLTLNTNFDKDITLKQWPLAEVESDFKPSFETRLFMLKESLKPSGYQVGVQSIYTSSPVSGGLPVMQISKNGIITNALFFNNLRLQVGANYWDYNYEVEDIEDLADGVITPILEAYPTVLPLSATDQLTKIESSSNGFDVPVAAQLLLRSQKSLTPYIGFGVVGRFTNVYTSEHHFFDYLDDDDYELSVNESIRSFDFGIWQGQVGLDYNLYKNWLLNIELNYSKSFKTPTFGLPNIQEYGGSMSIKYNF